MQVKARPGKLWHFFFVALYCYCQILIIRKKTRYYDMHYPKVTLSDDKTQVALQFLGKIAKKSVILGSILFVLSLIELLVIWENLRSDNLPNIWFTETFDFIFCDEKNAKKCKEN